MSSLLKNPAKEKLKSGGRVCGTMITSVTWPGIMEILANSGWDFVVIDTEHSLYNPETIEGLCRAGRQSGIVPLVRPADADYHLIARMLDLGAYGVMVPWVDTVAEASAIGNATRYPPMGKRGCGGNMVSLTGLPLAEYLQHANDIMLTTIMVESSVAVGIVDQLAAVPNTDVLVIGPTDLSINLGVPGKFDHPTFLAAAEKVVTAAEKHGKAAGIHVGSLKDSEMFAKLGFRHLMCSADAAMLRTASNELAAAMKELCAGGAVGKSKSSGSASPY
ncbi:MAG TPA: aldolase/citrate lyase family protein [Planctomycetota bacterium]|nr:aldolase/citrate lyase family protein [Planctomycetota bacterium]